MTGDPVREACRRLLRVALPAAALGLAGSMVALVADGRAFFRSWLLAWTVFSGIAVGCLPWRLLHRLTGGAWGRPVAPLLEAGSLAIVPLAGLFLPLLGGLQDLYPWARPDVVTADPLLRHKEPWLNVPFFVARAAAYLGLWCGLAWLLTRRSRAAGSGDGDSAARTRRLCGLGLAAYVLSATFAAVDWVMSLEPHWYSMVYGLLAVVGQGLGGIAFAVLLLGWLDSRARLSRDHERHDLGNLLLAFVMLWAYIAFTQFLIIWYGNLAEDVTWYERRSHAGWQSLAVGLAVLHFAAPFLLLLGRRTKRTAWMLAAVAGGLLVMRVADGFWTVMPAFRDGLSFRWTDLAALLAVGGVFAAFVAWRLAAHPPQALSEEAPGHA